MFTGIVEEIGKIKKVTKSSKVYKIEVLADKIMCDINLGDSIAVNGICLTVSKLYEKSFEVDVMQETLNRTSLAGLTANFPINLERAMAMNGRFGGHIVSGHIDGVGEISAIKDIGNSILVDIKTNPKILHYIIEKGSITIDGVSLTVVEINSYKFSVSLIPHTFKNTVFSKKRVGDKVNLENDLIGKYIEKFMNKNEGLSFEKLIKAGF